jgi:hypothetical protein
MLKKLVDEMELQNWVEDSTFPSYAHLEDQFWKSSEHVDLKIESKDIVHFPNELQENIQTFLGEDDLDKKNYWFSPIRYRIKEKWYRKFCNIYDITIEYCTRECDRLVNFFRPRIHSMAQMSLMSVQLPIALYPLSTYVKLPLMIIPFLIQEWVERRLRGRERVIAQMGISIIYGFFSLLQFYFLLIKINNGL